MSHKHNIETYSKLAEGINFYLNESFHYLNESLIYESASIFFSEKIQKIDSTDSDRKLIENTNLPESPVELLQSKTTELLTDETSQRLANEWIKAQEMARIEGYRFGLKHIINSIEILGHLNNFGFFIETIINRHLLFLRHSNLIDNLSYSRMSNARTIERLIYLFKEDLGLNQIQINEIISLFSLRNKTVHYTPDNAKSLKPRIFELLQIWNQTIKLIERFENIEKFNEDRFSKLLDEHVKIIKKRWT